MEDIVALNPITKSFCDYDLTLEFNIAPQFKKIQNSKTGSVVEYRSRGTRCSKIETRKSIDQLPC